MNGFRVASAALTAVVVAGSLAAVATGQQPTPLPTTSAPPPLGAEGLAVFPAVEGWGPSADGKSTLIQVGYYNRNKEQVIDIPIGPNNRIEPGGPDMGQPTHFEPGRSYGVFAISVPRDFGTKKLTWTLSANGQSSSISLWLNPPYWVDFYKKAATGNTPPVVKFSEAGPELSGPPVGTSLSLNATVGQPLPLSVWVKDVPDTYDPEEGLPADQRRGRQTAAAGRGRGEPPVANFDITAATVRGAGSQRGAGRFGPQSDATVTWKIHRGTSTVKFADPVIRVNLNEKWDTFQEAKTTATFSAAGEYVLRAQVNDKSGDGGGGEQCCWTDALVKVTVK